ncbi:uncharacterized protein LOC124267456 [Haliotis rubra]|uniref:uncharacterized protein LOC124267456 n=1 Tax=Haliotis rubra TaxID=36100 RepID=UPI001EE62AC5|nr:uncharacterized protein LOC124267456 [Haliotis rubra]
MHFAIDVIKFILAVKNVLIHDVRPLNVSCSAVQCGQWCAMDTSCVAFLYDHARHTCYPHPEVYTSLMKDQYIKKGGLKLYLDSKAQVCRVQSRHYSRQTGKCYDVHGDEEDILPVTTINPKAVQCRRLGHSYWEMGDICYRKMSKVTVWITALNDCRALNGTMFNVDSDIKHEFYVKVVAKQTNQRKSLLGTRKRNCDNLVFCENVWAWCGKPLTRFRWHDGFPKDWFTGNCVQYTWRENNYLWENVACYTARRYYCHFQIQ